MPGVRINEGESFENALKRFKKQCEKAGVLSEVRKRESYEKPSVKKKKNKDGEEEERENEGRGGGGEKTEKSQFFLTCV